MPIPEHNDPKCNEKAHLRSTLVFLMGSGCTAGLVIVSYMGMTKVSSVAEEVKDPERNLPLGMFRAFGSVVAIYVIGTTVMIGVAGVATLSFGGGDLTPVAPVAKFLVGRWGAVLMPQVRLDKHR
ncbi:MAG: amino acid transporter [Thalassolituus oleivorans]|jgi:amino acid transporter